jgi:hypothetical protein
MNKNMKKIILLLASTTLLILQGNAQENRTDFRDKLLFGVKGGLNYSNVYDTKGESFQADAKYGAAGGIFLSIPIGKFIGLQPELLFSQKGFSGTGRILGSTYSFTRTTNYLDIPFFFSLKASEFISLMAGPQYSYLLRQTDVFKNGSTTIEQEKEFENDNVRKNTLSFAAGMDINLKHIVLGIRAAWELQNNNGDGSSTTPRYKNAWYQFTVGYRFYN